MRLLRSLLAFLLIVIVACTSPPAPTKQIPAFLLRFAPDSFAYPVGEKDYVTEKNDPSDYWYNAQDFGESRHLGEDWNRTTGGDTDCGESVFAAADGEILIAHDAGPGWGNVVMIEHTAPDGTKLRSLYGHLNVITRSTGRISRREQIGTVGSANGRYKCHLHFEIRWMGSSSWNDIGPGYSDNWHGWIDPSEFIEQTRAPR
jgi:murein DD-endopeptidase MepM/ murein hydrolase activator NlpD